MSYIFRNVWISSFTLSSLNLYYVVKITHKLRFKKKYRFLQISTILGLIPIVNVVISRLCAFWFNFLYDFIQNSPNIHEFIVKMPFLDLKYHFCFGPPSGLNLDLNLTPPHMLQIQPPDGSTCIRCKFGHQMVPPSICKQTILPPFEASSIVCLYWSPLALITIVATRWRKMH